MRRISFGILAAVGLFVVVVCAGVLAALTRWLAPKDAE